MVFNSLGGMRNAVSAKSVITLVSQPMKINELSHNTDFVKSQLPWVTSSSLSVIHKSKANVDPTKIVSHYLCQTDVKSALIKYALVSVMQVDESHVQIQIAKEERAVFGAHINTFYHEAIICNFGLVTGQSEVFENVGPNFAEFHLANKRRLLSAIVDKRATQKMLALGDDPTPEPTPEPQPSPQPEEKKGPSITDIIGGAKNVIQSLAEGYKSIVDAFKTVKKEELKEKITGEGFSEYTSKSRYLRSIGIPKTYWETYKKQFMDLTGIAKNPRVKPEIETLLKMADFIQDNAWNTNDLTFDSTKGGTCSNFVCLTRYDAIIAKYHMMTTVVDGTFQLAPNVWIYSKYKSVAGGIVETTKIVTRNMPRSMTEADAKAINAMMLLTGINVMQENFGVPKTLPEFTEMTKDLFKKL
jgi:hypothetical protein